eukprot:TRINITY_DN2149_c0_g1_i1.p1 TRINITY_DN2149_c0_g1~~TRINITY_DN2149_c0_g1_i1.p1  ORF type:complete len:400 (-),score=75.92 TRINITY_DN2149_c0_g1_i1:39-1238(-)
MSRKVFVGSLPHGIEDHTLRATFGQYGQVTDVFIKPNCEVGRQWAFVTFASTEQAQLAKESCDRVLTFPGADRPCDVMLAKNQGMFGQAQDPGVGGGALPAAMPAVAEGPKKIFVGTLPDGCTEDLLRAEFCKYGAITEVFLKSGCEPGRQWAFVSFSSPAEAAHAKQCTDRILVMPGGVSPCEVTLARNQGKFGQDAIAPAAGQPVAMQPMYGQTQYAPPVAEGPKKIFVGSLPDYVTDETLRLEFGKFGQIVDIFIKPGCEPGRQWAFVTYASSDQASFAKESADRVLVIPGAEKAVEVMLARNQGRFGQDPVKGGVAPGVPAMAQAIPPGMQPPPPSAPAPLHLTQWRCYYTAAGLPYYHNHSTGVTQWEAPPELSTPAGLPPAPAGVPGVGYRPY